MRFSADNHYTRQKYNLEWNLFPLSEATMFLTFFSDKPLLWRTVQQFWRLNYCRSYLIRLPHYKLIQICIEASSNIYKTAFYKFWAESIIIIIIYFQFSMKYYRHEIIWSLGPMQRFLSVSFQLSLILSIMLYVLAFT